MNELMYKGITQDIFERLFWSAGRQGSAPFAIKFLQSLFSSFVFFKQCASKLYNTIIISGCLATFFNVFICDFLVFDDS